MKSFEDFLNEAFEEKDEKRIADILTKSGGDAAKAASLARTMANKITDLEKAIRRAEAAEAAGEDELAQIFYTRVEELGGDAPAKTSAPASSSEESEEAEETPAKAAPKKPAKTPAYSVGDYAKVSAAMILEDKVELSDGKSWRYISGGSSGERYLNVTSGRRDRWGSNYPGSATIDAEYLKELDNEGIFYIKLTKVTGTWLQGYTYFANGIINPNYLVRFKTSNAIPSGPELKIFLDNEAKINSMRDKNKFLMGDENFVMKKSGQSFGEFESGIYTAKSLDYVLSVKNNNPVFYCVPVGDKNNYKAMKSDDTLFIALKEFEKLTDTVTSSQMEVIAEWMSREIGAEVEATERYGEPYFRIPYFYVKGETERGYLSSYSAGPFFTREQAENEIARVKKEAETKKVPYSVKALVVVTGNPNSYSSNKAFDVTYSQLMDYAKLVGISTKIRKFFEERKGQIVSKDFGF